VKTLDLDSGELETQCNPACMFQMDAQCDRWTDRSIDNKRYNYED